jgi:hypothetical protein
MISAMARNKQRKRKRNFEISPGKSGPKPAYLSYPIENVEMLAMLGATDKQMALFFDVDETTVVYWLKNHPQFKDAVDRGGLHADMKVVGKLFQRAMGYDFEEEQLHIIQGAAVTYKVKKHIPPDMKAIMTWLYNRRNTRGEWTNNKRVEHAGTVNHEVLHEVKDIPIDQLPQTEQDYLFNILQKQLEDGQRSN